MNDKHLFIFQSSPYINIKFQDTLEMIVAFTCFEKEVSIAFMQEACLGLIGDQTSTQDTSHPAPHKNIQNIVHGVLLNDIQQFYIDGAAIEQYDINSDEFEAVNIISGQDMGHIIKQYDKTWVI